MGRTLDLSQLTDAEAQHVWAVVQRDLALRRKEEERLRVLRSGSLEWYYQHLRARFKRFGSAKVIRSLSGRLQGTGAVPSAEDGSSDSEQTDEDPDTHAETAVRPLGSKTKRRLSVHGGDFLDSQDAALSPTDSLEALTDEPSSERTLVTEDADASNWECHPGLGEQRDSPPPFPQDTLAGHHLSAESGPTATPGPDDPGQQQASPEGSATLSTRDGDNVRAHGVAPHPSQRSSPPASESQTPEPTDADREEAALRRELEKLVAHLSEDEEGPVGRSSTLGAAPEVPRVELHRQSPADPTEDKRTTAEELMELEDKVATAATEVQQAESEVTDIRSRIAALQAAGLTVRPSGTPQRKSNLPVLLPRLARRSPGDPHANAPKQDPVVTAPGPLGATLKGSPRALGSSFERESLYRSSLTQRNPSGRSASARLGFAKPVMTHQP